MTERRHTQQQLVRSYFERAFAVADENNVAVKAVVGRLNATITLDKLGFIPD
jgi:hypothetical protein